MLAAKKIIEKYIGCCIDPTFINTGRLGRKEPNLMDCKWEVTQRTEPNLIHFKYSSRVNRHSQKYKFKKKGFKSNLHKKNRGDECQFIVLHRSKREIRERSQ